MVLKGCVSVQGGVRLRHRKGIGSIVPMAELLLDLDNYISRRILVNLAITAETTVSAIRIRMDLIREQISRNIEVNNFKKVRKIRLEKRYGIDSQRESVQSADIS